MIAGTFGYNVLCYVAHTWTNALQKSVCETTIPCKFSAYGEKTMRWHVMKCAGVPSLVGNEGLCGYGAEYIALKITAAVRLVMDAELKP